MLKNFIREIMPPFLHKMAHKLRETVRARVIDRKLELADRAPEIVPTIPARPNLAFRHALAFEDRVPDLKAFGFRITSDNAAALLEFYNWYVPLIREEARGACVRTLLARLRKAAPSTAEQASRLIASLDLADGIPDRSQRLRNDPVFGEDLSQQTAAFEKAYGAKIITEKWGSPSRGASLLHYLKNHPELVAGKDVLHIAPEDELRDWLRATTRKYTILDGVPDEGTDIGADITAIPIPDGTFDFILCHRVLEHVLDDIGAMRELHRILRPGGTLNMSVPQAVHRQRTAEWLVPDESHDWHVRQYGQDLRSRLESVGFVVQPVNWLCEQPRDTLLAIGAIPMRLFAAAKSD